MSLHSQKQASPRRPAPHQRQEIPSVFQTDDYFTSQAEQWRSRTSKTELGPNLRGQLGNTVLTTSTAIPWKRIYRCSGLKEAIAAFFEQLTGSQVREDILHFRVSFYWQQQARNCSNMFLKVPKWVFQFSFPKETVLSYNCNESGGQRHPTCQ